jgi:hypothetical protein
MKRLSILARSDKLLPIREQEKQPIQLIKVLNSKKSRKISGKIHFPVGP